ncbi:condensation domain-containing protein, partial [Flavobacterium sp. LS1R47]
NGYTQLYKTGDLVRWLANETLEYIGRGDNQVKIRGYRIELGEIEHAMSQIEGIMQVSVQARDKVIESGSSKYLVGYYILNEDGIGLTVDAIERSLSGILPDYMIPSAFVEMDSFPLTANGKLNKSLFADPDFNSSDSNYLEPTTYEEIEVCKIWSDLLCLDRVGITDDFFKIGGNSILAIQVSHRTSKILGKDVKVSDVFKYKTITQLLAHVINQSQIIIPKIDVDQIGLSFAQERLWFIEQFEEGTNAYHIPVLYELDATANKEGLKHALQEIVTRHEVLRTTIEQGEDDEFAIQKVNEEPLSILEITWSETDDYELSIREAINRPFNLSSEYPIRVNFYTINSETDASLNKTILLINIHHIATDGWSKDIFEKEVLAYYNAYLVNNKGFKLPELEIQYKDYALWQRNYLTGDILEKQLGYWKEKLMGYQTLEFPTDYARSSVVDYRGASQEFTLNKGLSKKLRDLAQREGVTLNSLLLSAVNILLGKYTGQNDIVIGTAIANRH